MTHKHLIFPTGEFPVGTLQATYDSSIIRCNYHLGVIITRQTGQVWTSAALAAVFWSAPWAFFFSAAFLAFFCWDWIFCCPRAMALSDDLQQKPRVRRSSTCSTFLGQKSCYFVTQRWLFTQLVKPVSPSLALSVFSCKGRTSV